LQKSYFLTQIEDILGDGVIFHSRFENVLRIVFSPTLFLAGLLAAFSAAVSADGDEGRRHLLPFVADGENTRSRLLLTKVTDSSGGCSVHLVGPDLGADRFADHYLVTAGGARADFDLGGDGGSLVWTSEGGNALTFGYAALDCAVPVTASVLVSAANADGLVALTSLDSAGKADKFQFSLIPSLGSLLLVFANDTASDAACEVTLQTPYGSDLGSASISLPPMASVYRAADELFRIPEDYTAGAVRAACDRELAATGFLLKGDRFTALPPVVFPMPLIGVSGATAVTEGGDAIFTVTAEIPPTRDLTILLAVAEGEGYVDAADLGEKQVILDAGQTTANYVIATVDDGAHGADGAVAVSLIPSDGYVVSDAAGSARVTINNDEPLPGIAITGGPEVSEGEDAHFTITTDVPSAADLPISLTVSEDEGYVDAENLGEKQVILAAGQTTANYAIATVDDADAGDGGAVTVAVNPLDGYRISEAGGSARVTITDNDEPERVDTGQPSSQTQPPAPSGSNPPPQPQPQPPPRPALTGWSVSLGSSSGRSTTIRWEFEPEGAKTTIIKFDVRPDGAGNYCCGSLADRMYLFRCRGGFKGVAELHLWPHLEELRVVKTFRCS